jgi:Arc/MetJ-type ribon-helix-helix transcriptional regulator
MTDVKAGRRNSKADSDAIKEAIKLLQGVLGELEEAEDNDPVGEDEPEVNEASEEQKASNPKAVKLLEYINSMED